MVRDKLTASLVWEHAEKDIVVSPHGYIIFDDTVLDKTGSEAIIYVHWQIENNVNQLLDVTYWKDQSRIRDEKH